MTGVSQTMKSEETSASVQQHQHLKYMRKQTPTRIKVMSKKSVTKKEMQTI